MRSTALLLALALLANPALADDESPSLRDVSKGHRTAFKKLKFPPAAKLRATIEGRLPMGVVTVATPFTALINSLLTPFEARMKEREEAVAALAGHPAQKVGKLLLGTMKTLAEEDGALAREVSAVEAAYAEVYNRGFMELGLKERRTRKAAAVLIPFYRRIMARNAEVREAVGDVLATMHEPADLAWLAAEASKAKEPGFRREAALALARIGGDEARAAVARIAREDERPGVRVQALAALMLFPVREVIGEVIAALGDPAWEVRALAVRITACANLVPAVGPLIEALAKEEGRLVTDLDAALGVLTGVRMGGDPDLWKKWWSEHREEVETKAGKMSAEGAFDEPLGPIEAWLDPDREDVAEKDAKATASFYGIVTNSRRVVFIIDISRSMETPAGRIPSITGGAPNPYDAPRGKSRLAVAKWQLHRAIHELPKEARFNLIVYSESYRVWRPDMSTAKPGEKKKAHAFIDGLNHNGTTNICDSLDRALAMAGVPPPLPGKDAGQLEVDTIFLLSDGDPNRGRITDFMELLKDVAARTSAARIVIHTVGIGETAGSTFLEELAVLTGGRYVGLK